MNLSTEAGQFKNISATGTVYGASGVLEGFYVNSTTGGTLVLRDGGSGGTVMNGGVITPAIGFHRFPTQFNNLHATIANTLDVTFFFKPTGV